MSKAIKDLNSFMEKKRLTQLKLSELIGMSQGYLSSVMSGDVIPADKIKKRIEEKVGIKVINWYK